MHVQCDKTDNSDTEHAIHRDNVQHKYDTNTMDTPHDMMHEHNHTMHRHNMVRSTLRYGSKSIFEDSKSKSAFEHVNWDFHHKI